MTDHGDFFNRDELECPCCHECKMDEDFILKLDEARLLAGIPFPINSGYRCQKHNEEEKSTSKNHTSGKAVDIKCHLSGVRRVMINSLIQAGFNRIGIGKTFLHADTMDYGNGSPKSYWVY